PRGLRRVRGVGLVGVPAGAGALAGGARAEGREAAVDQFPVGVLNDGAVLERDRRVVLHLVGPLPRFEVQHAADAGLDQERHAALATRALLLVSDERGEAVGERL